MPEVRAKDVEVLKFWQARCKITGCNWRSDLCTEYQFANQERLAHLEEHRNA